MLLACLFEEKIIQHRHKLNDNNNHVSQTFNDSPLSDSAYRVWGVGQMLQLECGVLGTCCS